MKKKIVLIVSLCILILGLTACGEDPKKVDYNGYTYDQLEQTSQDLASTLVALSDEDVDNFINQGMDELTVGLVKKWKELKPSLGTYADLGDFSIEKSGKTLTTMQIMDFSGRDVTLTCVYNYLDMKITDITLDEIYSLGEKMQKALMNTVMGLGTVFLILIVISLIIWGFKVIPYLQKQAEAKKAAAMPQQPEPVIAVPEVMEQPVQQDDMELVAVIAAAIAAAEGTSADGFVVRSIRRRK